MPDKNNAPISLSDNAGTNQIIGGRGSPSVAEMTYLDMPGAHAQCAGASNIIGVVGYGMRRPDFLPPACPFIAAPLVSARGGAMLELWRASGPCQAIRFGPVSGAYSSDLAFGAITLAEAADTCFEESVEAAYLAIFDFLANTGFTAPLRFWNYLTDITHEDAGLERYRRFNIGRQRAFEVRLQEALPPAASGVGGNHGPSVIYFLAAHAPARPIENPRQVSAFAYPAVYGPQSPSFSRASIYQPGATTLMFISGTASIVGHESRHADDLPGQTAETIENLRTLMGASGITSLDNWAFKIYLRNPAHHDVVDFALVAAFGAASQRLYLQGEICRPELMLEIEAFYSAG